MSTICTENTDAVAGHHAESATDRFTRPRYRAAKDEDGFQLEIEVPGAAKSGVTLTLSEGVLTITAKRSDAAPGTWKPLLRELAGDDYQFRLQLDSKIDLDGIGAKLDDGILRVNLPLRDQAKPRVITVN